MTGKELSVYTLGSAAFLAYIRECEIEENSETQENRALSDAWRHPVDVIGNWRMTFTVAADDVLSFATNSETNMTNLMKAVRTSVSVTVSTSDASGNGTQYAGTGLLTQGNHRIPNGLQEGVFTITGQGPLTPSQL